MVGESEFDDELYAVDVLVEIAEKMAEQFDVEVAMHVAG
jgi:hypothetical protein